MYHLEHELSLAHRDELLRKAAAHRSGRDRQPRSHVPAIWFRASKKPEPRERRPTITDIPGAAR